MCEREEACCDYAGAGHECGQLGWRFLDTWICIQDLGEREREREREKAVTMQVLVTNV